MENTMTDIPHIEIRQCHSYSKTGARCEHPAGHTGKHYISVEWSDAEAWTPLDSASSIPMGVADGLIIVDDLPQPVYVGSGMCAICEHPHHPDGVCGADDGGFDCDCATSVED
jgi:hypothetical protein